MRLQTVTTEDLSVTVAVSPSVTINDSSLWECISLLGKKKSNLFLKIPPASFNWDCEFLLIWMQVSTESVKEGDKSLI